MHSDKPKQLTRPRPEAEPTSAIKNVCMCTSVVNFYLRRAAYLWEVSVAVDDSASTAATTDTVAATTTAPSIK